MWRQPDHAEVVATRDTAEEAVAAAAGLTLRRFLRQATAAATAALDTPALVAAGTPPPDPITLGTFQRFWAAVFAAGSLQQRIRDAWTTGHQMHSNRRILSTSADALPVYMANTTDRLVRGLVPPIADDAFDLVRVTLTSSAALGWDRRTTTQRLAHQLGWETNAPYWRTQFDHTNTQIDRILDPLGAPGTAAREHARLHDPVVNVLQNDRSTIVRHLDAEGAYWQTRADRIARTETTAGYGAGSVTALTQEGQGCKEWLATADSRTRPEHGDADGQTVPTDGQFDIGGYLADFPGDPSLPAGLSVNCRCCVVGGDCANLS